MNKKKTGYSLINILVILIATVWFVYQNKDFGRIFVGEKAALLIAFTVSVAVVHIIKAGRLYLALYGSDVKRTDYVKTYCKVTPVSLIFPLKLGEFFRMYCYGILMNNVLKGIIIILLDRFMDTIALVSVIFFVMVAWQWHIAPIAYILLMFLVFILILYFVFPGVYKFWKKYLLKENATRHKLTALKFLEHLNEIYHEVENVAKGRGIILYFMSVIAWVVEIGSITILNGVAGSGNIDRIISNYLTSAVSGRQSVELKKFATVSVVLLLGLYIVIKAVELLAGKKDR